jgi:membrane protein required for colicin V production
MSLFDLGAGLVLLVSISVGWFRGGTREVAGVAAIVVAAVVSLLALHLTGPIARGAIHTPWLANITAILAVFGAVYILLRVGASALSRRLQQSKSLGTLDRAIGAGFGLVRALVILGLANLVLNAVTPPEKLPTWISGAMLYPATSVSADALRAFAPQGAKLVSEITPAVGVAITSGADDNSISGNSTQGADQNRRYNGPSTNGVRPRGETSR